MTDKICKNCKHHKRVDCGDSYTHLCYREAKKIVSVDPVTGKKTSYFQSRTGCDYIRSSPAPFHCGKDGQFYEPKETLLFKLKMMLVAPTKSEGPK